MFTQCSKCETVFRLSAQVLRAAGGQVRCGRCGEVFNALTRLAEDMTGFTAGESSFDEETRADEILESSGASAEIVEVDDAPPPGTEIARLEFLEPFDNLLGEASLEATPRAGEPADDVTPLLGQTPTPRGVTPAAGVEIARVEFLGLFNHLVSETSLEVTPRNRGNESSLEFSLPPGELDRIFVETHSNPLGRLVTDPPGEQFAGTASRRPERVAHTMEEPGPACPPVPPPNSVPQVPSTPPVPSVPPVTPVPEPVPLTRIPGLEVSDDVRQAMISSLSHSKLPQLREPRALPLSVWLTAAIVLGLSLLIQMLSGRGGWLSTPASLLGGSASPSTRLAAYQLRQWGVTGDPMAKGILKVRASIMNTAALLQPYPLLRVSLVNRFGTRVGAREFEPADYLGKGTARLLAPGERADATLDILDPGKDAEGFEIDVCVRGVDKSVYCAADDAAQTK